jgi:5-methylcytosine-specific restriction endonuclease McrA
MVRSCEHCGKSYKRANGATKRRFCSNRCAKAAEHGQKQFTLQVLRRGVNSKNGRSSVSALKAYKEAFPRCQRCGWNEEPTILHVHHKDRNRRNYDYSNLETLCPTCHVLEHFRAKDSIWGRYRKTVTDD